MHTGEKIGGSSMSRFEEVLDKFEQEEIRDNVRKLVQDKFHL